MTATSTYPTAAATGRLHVALEMGWSRLKVGSCDGRGSKPRICEIKARDQAALEGELAKAKQRFRLPADAPVHICFEAGRDGFWLQRWLTSRGYHCLVVDPASMKVNRRRKRAKTDRLDACLLLDHLLDYLGGKKDAWSVVVVPTLAQEDRRQLHRELETLKGERTEHSNRIRSLLATLGLAAPKELHDFVDWLGKQRLPENDEPVPGDFAGRLLREHQRWQLASVHIAELQEEQRRRVAQAKADDEGHAKVKKLLSLKGLGVKSASLFVWEVFGWRKFANRRQLAGMSGLVPTPYQSSDMERELGISKTGNSWLRGMMGEIAWMWLKWQPQSSLSQWYWRRFGYGAKRVRKIGIVALARKLLIALWRWVEFDIWPEGAVATPWEPKVA